MRAKRTTFKTTLVPALLLAPQLLITAVFFVWPAAQAVWSVRSGQARFPIATQPAV